MDAVLAQALVRSHLINTGTEVEALHAAKGLGPLAIRVQGSFTVEAIRQTTGGRLVFLLRNTLQGIAAKVFAEDIVRIDGMEPATFAHAFRLDPQGEPLQLGRKRGRKSKPDLIALMIEEFQRDLLLDADCPLDVILDDEDDETTGDADAAEATVYVVAVEYDEDGPLIKVETIEDRTEYWITPTNIISIDGIPLAELIEDFKAGRRAELARKKELRHGRRNQLRVSTAGQAAAGA
jgi:hypothetical protein